MLPELVLVLPVLLLSVVVHEYAHARVALAQGDETALRAGRLTLNPIVHIELVGSILVPLGLWVMTNGSAIFGWAKPVPVDPGQYRDYRKGDILVSSAGVAANLILALGFVAFSIIVLHVTRGLPGVAGAADVALRLGSFGIFINILLAVFNLVPIPPLDGSHILYHLLPRDLRSGYRKLGRFGMLALFLLLIVPGALDVVLWPVWRLNELAVALVRLTL